MEIRTACNRDCPDACEMVATVEAGRVVKLAGARDHPVTRGFLCYRTNRFLERQYDPARITTPLLREGDRFKPVSWEEALDLAARKMLAIRAESGPASILYYRSGGSLGLMKEVGDLLFRRFGPVTVKSGDICSGAGDAAQVMDFGFEEAHDIFDLLNSRAILIWGRNPYNSSSHLVPILREAKARGSRLALVDPLHQRTRELCELVLQPRPGGDIALALGVARRLFEGGRADPGAGDYCDHLDEFRGACFARSIAEWATLADVSERDLLALADLYAEGPSAILVGWGMQRRGRGAATVRVLDALSAISGNLGVAGGGVNFSTVRRLGFNLDFQREGPPPPRTIPEPLLGPGILAARDPEIRMIWVAAANPVAMLPESATVARALATREFTVVVDSFMTDSARAAHLVLPTTTMLEDDDLVGSYGHHWLAEVRPVVPPPPGVKTDYRIAQELAPRIGLGDDAGFGRTVEAWKRHLLSRLEPQGAGLDDLRRGALRNPERPRVLFADRRFPTASGRVNLIRDPDPEPPRPTRERPLLLMALSTRRSQSSQWPAREQTGPAVATVHPEAAAGFAEGDIVRVESEIGELTVRLAFDARQRRDVLLMDKGGWFSAGRAANALVRAASSDAGGCAAYYDTPVRLLPAR